jgi:xanthine dehydrogenase D subunit
MTSGTDTTTGSRLGTDAVGTETPGGIGESAQRPDGIRKVLGEFAYGSDLWMDGMLWGVTLRSPHPSARITKVDITEALATAGVFAVLTHDDVPGAKYFGLEVQDQPVLAIDVVRYQGEPIALVAADHPETARRAMQRIVVEYDVLEPVIDAEQALLADSPRLHPDGNLVRHVRIRTGDPEPAADVVVSGDYEVGMQDQAFLGPESGLAVPDGTGGVDLYVATQWLHVDQRQVCSALGLPPDRVRLQLAGVGGAFGGREDLSMHVHGCLLALHTGKPVKMVYNREESFFGHVHRHPAKMHYEFGADRDGTLVYARATVHLDGGAYASSTPAVVGNAGTMGFGPYRIPHLHMDCYGAYTNNPPCGAMRGFGSVQTAFAVEAMMDKLADAVGLDPVELRVRNGYHEGARAPTGQVIDSAAPVAELVQRLQALPLPRARSAGDGGTDLREMPGGVSNTTHGEGVRRGVGYAVAYKNVAFSEGFDDYSTARVRLAVVEGRPVATVHTAAAEVGQGLVTIEQQICRTELGVEHVVVAPQDTQVGSAGSSSASRQTYVTGGAVKAACESVRALVLTMAAQHGLEADDLRLEGEQVVSRVLGISIPLADLLGDVEVEDTVEWRHRPTSPIDPETGQGDAHVQYAFAAHRAVVDVDVELGLVKVVELACTQDVGKALNPQAVVGQIQGGSTQGMGLALMEEIQIVDGKITNPSFTDYLIPTILDTPPMPIEVLEYGDPHAPYGLRGVGEAPTISSGPAVMAAIRAATGLDLRRVPVRPEDVTGTR